jgi:hypothetical protein
LDRLDLYPAYDVARKGIGEQISGGVAAYSASPQVEQSLLIELAYRCAMRAPHIIREYLQLRLRIDQGVRRKQEVLVGLVGIGFLSILANDDLAVENSSRFAVQDSFVQFPAGAVGLRMIDGCVVIDMLVAFGDIEAPPVAMEFETKELVRP